MGRMSETHLLALTALLVALILCVVVFAELPAIIRSSDARPRASAPAAPPTPTPATPAPGLSLVTGSFRLQAPAGFEVNSASAGYALLYLDNHARTDGLETIQISAMPGPGIDIASWQEATLTTVERNGPLLGTCVPQTRVTVGGVSGTEIGYRWSATTATYSPPGVPKPAPGTPICDVYWFGTNTSDNVAYWFRFAAAQSEYSQFAPLAEQVRASVTWRL